MGTANAAGGAAVKGGDSILAERLKNWVDEGRLHYQFTKGEPLDYVGSAQAPMPQPGVLQVVGRVESARHGGWIVKLANRQNKSWVKVIVDDERLTIERSGGERNETRQPTRIGEENQLHIAVQPRAVQVYLNGMQVGGDVTLPDPLLPCTVALGATVPPEGTHVVFDRLIVRPIADLAKIVKPASPSTDREVPDSFENVDPNGGAAEVKPKKPWYELTTDVVGQIRSAPSFVSLPRAGSVAAVPLAEFKVGAAADCSFALLPLAARHRGRFRIEPHTVPATWSVFDRDVALARLEFDGQRLSFRWEPTAARVVLAGDLAEQVLLVRAQDDQAHFRLKPADNLNAVPVRFKGKGDRISVPVPSGADPGSLSVRLAIFGGVEIPDDEVLAVGQVTEVPFVPDLKISAEIGLHSLDDKLQLEVKFTRNRVPLRDTVALRRAITKAEGIRDDAGKLGAQQGAWKRAEANVNRLKSLRNQPVPLAIELRQRIDIQGGSPLEVVMARSPGVRAPKEIVATAQSGTQVPQDKLSAVLLAKDNQRWQSEQTGRDEVFFVAFDRELRARQVEIFSNGFLSAISQIELYDNRGVSQYVSKLTDGSTDKAQPILRFQFDDTRRTRQMCIRIHNKAFGQAGRCEVDAIRIKDEDGKEYWATRASRTMMNDLR